MYRGRIGSPATALPNPVLVPVGGSSASIAIDLISGARGGGSSDGAVEGELGRWRARLCVVMGAISSDSLVGVLS